MSRLSEKLAAAAAVAPRQAAKIEARADRIIASEPALEAQADDAFGPHESLLAEAEKGMHGLKHQLAGFVNGDPLEHSAALLAAVEGALSPTQQPGSGAPTEPGPTSGADVV